MASRPAPPYTEGQKYTNDSGEKLIYTNGAWETDETVEPFISQNGAFRKVADGGNLKTTPASGLNYNAFPSWTQLPSGRIIIAYRKAYSHFVTGRIYVHYSDDGMRTFSDPIEVAPHGGKDMKDPSVSVVTRGGKQVACITWAEHSSNQSDHTSHYAFSDEGETWYDETQLPNISGAPVTFVIDKMVETPSGAWLTTAYNVVPSPETYVYRSTNEGATWTQTKIETGTDEGSLLLDDEGVIRLYCRYSSVKPYVTSYISVDDGVSFTKVPLKGLNNINFTFGCRPDCFKDSFGSYYLFYRAETKDLTTIAGSPNPARSSGVMGVMRSKDGVYWEPFYRGWVNTPSFLYGEMGELNGKKYFVCGLELNGTHSHSADVYWVDFDMAVQEMNNFELQKTLEVLPDLSDPVLLVDASQEADGATTVSERSSFAQPVTASAVNVVTLNGKKYVDFNTSGFVEMPAGAANEVHNGQGFTVAVKMRLKARTANEYFSLITTNGGSSSAVGIQFCYDNRSVTGSKNTLRANVTKGVSGQNVASLIADEFFEFEKDFTLVLTFNPVRGTYTMYRDGEEVFCNIENVNGHNPVAANQKTALGRISGTPTNGLLQKFVVLPYHLSACQVRALNRTL